MRNISVKMKITVWITLLMTVLFALLLAFMVFISNSVIRQTAMKQLAGTVQEKITQIQVSDGKIQFAENFLFYKNGVSILVYSKKESLLAGQLPVSFTTAEPFQNGQLRTVRSDQTSYLVLDLWIPDGWENGFWMRGLMEAPESGQTVRNLVTVAFIALPFFIFLTAFGGYGILRRAFRPLSSITRTAENINEAKDLSRRIGLPPGKNEFSRLAAVIDALFERLEKSFEGEKQFTADASHELRTPVSIIKGACEYAEKYEETPEERRETISMIHRQANKMSDLISQLLNITRLDQGVDALYMEEIDLGALIKKICRERTYDQNCLGLNLQDNVTVKGDAALLTRLAENLIDNAFKYGLRETTPASEVLQISVFQEGEEALLRVQDYGPGIPQEHQEKIWQRFYQVDASRGQATGAGLGLAMVRQIAQLHGGYMTLESTEGKGSCFTLHLPFSEKKKSF